MTVFWRKWTSGKSPYSVPTSHMFFSFFKFNFTSVCYIASGNPASVCTCYCIPLKQLLRKVESMANVREERKFCKYVDRLDMPAHKEWRLHCILMLISPQVFSMVGIALKSRYAGTYKVRRAHISESKNVLWSWCQFRIRNSNWLCSNAAARVILVNLDNHLLPRSSPQVLDTACSKHIKDRLRDPLG